MKKPLFMSVFVAFMLFFCANQAFAGDDKENVKGPATVDLPSFTVKVPKGWQVARQGRDDCTLEPIVKPNIDGKSNFGWEVRIYALSGKYFKPEKFIETDLNIYNETKQMPELKIGNTTFMYNFYDYEYGKHSLLAAALPSGGAVEITIGGYSVEDKEVKAILKSLKLK